MNINVKDGYSDIQEFDWCLSDEEVEARL